MRFPEFEKTRGTGPRVLCLDGGGIRGLAEIQILKELMLQVRLQNQLDYTPEPRQCFDFICGTSTGGLLAVLIGRLGKDLKDCDGFFRELGPKIFSGGSSRRTARLILTGSKHASEGLANSIHIHAGGQNMYESESIGLEKGHVPVSVVAVSGTTRTQSLFRTYGIRAASQEVSVVDACRATSAATTFFEPITINGVSYVDGAFGMNNPSSAALKELESGEGLPRLLNAVREVGCLVSIGTGRPAFDRKKASVLSKLTPKGVASSTSAADRCIKIATDCHRAHEDIRYRFRQEGRTDVYHRFDVDIGLESIKLDEADADTLEHITAVTSAYIASQLEELRSCAMMICPEAPGDPSAKTPPGLLVSSLPLFTDFFYGRQDELELIQRTLNPSNSGRKNILLCGLGGSGKTQLALRHIQQNGRRYSAVIWIDVSTEEHARRSCSEVASWITSQWPRDVPMVYFGLDDTLKIIARLRSTRFPDWLLVLDSAERLGPDELAKYIPCSSQGSVLVTSTRCISWDGFQPGSQLVIEGLDSNNSQKLLMSRAGRMSYAESDHKHVREITKELSGIPLALEQAGALIRNGEFSFSDFMIAYRTQYEQLMTNSLQSDRKRIITTILDMTYQFVSRRPDHAALLSLIGSLGPWQIPITLLEKFDFSDFKSPNHMLEDIAKIKSLIKQPNFLRLALRQLSDLCIINIREESGSIKSFMIHRLMCQWNVENIIRSGKKDYLIHVACHLAKQVFRSESIETNFIWELGASYVDRRYLAPLAYSLERIRTRMGDDIDPRNGRLRLHYASIIMRMAWTYLAVGPIKLAKDYILEAVVHETLRIAEQRLLWPKSQRAIILLCGLAWAYHKSGDLDASKENFGSAVEISRKIYGSKSKMTSDVVLRQRIVARRREVMSKYHDSAVIASSGPRRDVKPPRTTQQLDILEGSVNQLFREAIDAGDHLVAEELLKRGADIEARDNTGRTPLHRAFLEILLGGKSLFSFLLDKGASIEARDEDGNTLLLVAARHGDLPLFKFILERGADIDAKDYDGRTLLVKAAYQKNWPLVNFLLKKGADIDSRDYYGCTLLSTAVSSNDSISFEQYLEYGANIDTTDLDGCTPLALASQQGNKYWVERLLDEGADIEAKTNLGKTPLMLAAYEGHKTVLGLLLKRGAEIGSRARSGETALMWASNQGHEEVVQILVNHGAGYF